MNARVQTIGLPSDYNRYDKLWDPADQKEHYNAEHSSCYSDLFNADTFASAKSARHFPTVFTNVPENFGIAVHHHNGCHTKIKRRFGNAVDYVCAWTVEDQDAGDPPGAEFVF